jgi:two-component system, chemotaxis family, protein-glutamate methylesterase/glutaminase
VWCLLDFYGLIELKKIKVLVIDDSAVIRKLLSEILSMDIEIEVVGTAMDPYIAREKIKKLQPDVITLDIEMPKMNGISFLKNIMRLRPMPVVMISSLTLEGADIALEALDIGAVDYISKPEAGATYKLEDYADEVVSKVKSAAKVRVFPGERSVASSAAINILSTNSVVFKQLNHKTGSGSNEKIIAIGASTGGTEAIKEILVKMRPDSPAVMIAQHIPKMFSAAFARRMNEASPMTVCEAEHRQIISRGHVYIAPGDSHLKLRRSGSSYYCELDEGEPVNRHMPSVDVLFESVAKNAGPDAIGILLTGMGKDGARGLRSMLEAGADTIAQDEMSSVIWGMPGEAVKLNAASNIVPLNRMVEVLDALLMTTNATTS